MWPFAKDSLKMSGLENDMTEDQVRKMFEEQQPAKQTETIVDERTQLVDNTKDVRKKEEEPCALQYYFDEFFMCYTPKSQLRNWYRYGEKNDCAERWQDLQWCLKTRMVDHDIAQSMLETRRLERLRNIRASANSEDVWDIRETLLKRPWQSEASQKDGVSIS